MITHSMFVMRVILGCWFLFLLVVNLASAADIHGSIYDLSLNKMGNAVVEIDTAPKQFYVSKDGTYSFTVPIGFYSVKAEHYEGRLLVSSTSENLTVKDDGDYVLDLVLFPIINEEELLEDEIEAPKKDFYVTYFVIAAIVVLVGVFLLYVYKKKTAKNSRREEEDVGGKETNKGKSEEEKEEENIAEPELHGEEFLDKVIEIIKEEGGRTTQKEIRKNIPLSEAKISLIISELEAKGRVRKIKRGRGNIILLEK